MNLDPEVLKALQQFDTCSVLNAVETFHVRLRNEGYARPGLRWMVPSIGCAIGYASTLRVKSSNPPMRGTAFDDRTDWWRAMQELPGPKIAVVQDIDEAVGVGSVAGEVHAAIMQRLGCVALITDGSVRDLQSMRNLGFACSARSISPSHAYGHTVGHSLPVEILGLTIETGDLLMADCHGVISIPMEIAPHLAEVAAKLRDRDRQIVDFCRSGDFSLDQLQAMVK